MKLVSYKKLLLSCILVLAASSTPQTKAKLIIGKAQMNGALRYFSKSVADSVLEKYSLNNIKKALDDETIRRYIRIAIDEACTYADCDAGQLFDTITEKIKEILADESTKNIAKKIAETITQEINAHPELADKIVEKIEQLTKSSAISSYIQDMENRIAKKMTQELFNNLNSQETRTCIAHVAQTVLGILLLFNATRPNSGFLHKIGCLAAGIPCFWYGIKGKISPKKA